MPELPEVETVRRSLEGLVGRRVLRAEVLSPGLVRYPALAEFLTRISGRTFTALDRRAKYLLLKLDSGDDLMVHLKMTGRLLHRAPSDPAEPHTHIILHLDDGSELRFEDTRKFGGFYLIGQDREGAPPGFQRLGPEPLSADFTPSYLRRVLSRRQGRIKSLLLNQDIVAGLGNIYADEALFRARIHPGRGAASLTPAETHRLHEAINLVILESLALGGTSFSRYVDGKGNKGRNVENLRVYGREGQPCLVCGDPIARLVIGGRSAHFCPRCQPARPSRRRGGSGRAVAHSVGARRPGAAKRSQRRDE